MVIELSGVHSGLKKKVLFPAYPNRFASIFYYFILSTVQIFAVGSNADIFSW